MMPKTSSKGKETRFVSEAAYDQLLEDLETENRELVDAVTKFKREQDETVDKLGRRIVDLEHQMIKWLEQSPAAGTSSELKASTTETISIAAITPEPSIETADITSSPYTAAATEEIVLPKSTIRGRYPELFAMHDKGRSIEQIAKAMGINKGEVQLILQLVRREEQQHA
jgi:DNA-directed RNA polymerase specialized sigma24 family protein